MSGPIATVALGVYRHISERQSLDAILEQWRDDLRIDRMVIGALRAISGALAKPSIAPLAEDAADSKRGRSPRIQPIIELV